MSENIKVTFDTAEEDLHVNLDAGAIMYGKLKVGTTTTGDAGTSAKVENVGTNVNAILNFTIPKGDKGEQGIQGIQGERGLDGLGVPAGGTTGQVLAKKSGNDNDTEWVDFVNGVKDIPANTNVDEFYEEGVYAWNGDDGKAITGLPNDIVDMPSFSYMLKITKHSTMTNEKNKFEHYFQEFWLEGLFIYTRKITVRTGLETGRIFYERYSWERKALVNYDGVTVVSTEPTNETEKAKVWLQKNKNLFNKNNFLPNSSTSAEGVLISNNSTNTYYIPVEYGNSYIMSFVNNGVSGNVLYGFCDTQPSLGVSCTYNVATADKLNNMKFTPVSENNKYLCIRLRYDDAQIPYMSNIQVEQGTTATSYEENATSAIYTKESNNKYEKFSETVAISSEEPINQNGLWLQKGKNLFNKNNLSIGYRLGSDGLLFADSSYSTSNFIPVKPNTTYSVNWAMETRECVCYYDENKTFISRNVSTNPFTTPENCKYIRTSRLSTEVNTAQIEQGSTATEYEEYKEKKIYIKKDNGGYEEFINVDEIKITTKDFSSEVIFNETAANISFFKNGNVIEITYQGEAKTHKPNDILFILPTECRPTKDRYFPFVKNADAYGVAIVARDGNCVINQINSTTASGRIYFTITYIIEKTTDVATTSLDAE